MLQQSHAAPRRATQDGGDFAGAFWLCAQCARALAPLAGLRAAAELGATVGGVYEESVARLEAALQAACADFRAPLYAAVLEGYVHLGNVAGLGEEARPTLSRVPCAPRVGEAAADVRGTPSFLPGGQRVGGQEGKGEGRARARGAPVCVRRCAGAR